MGNALLLPLKKPWLDLTAAPKRTLGQKCADLAILTDAGAELLICVEKNPVKSSRPFSRKVRLMTKGKKDFE